MTAAKRPPRREYLIHTSQGPRPVLGHILRVESEAGEVVTFGLRLARWRDCWNVDHVASGRLVGPLCIDWDRPKDRVKLADALPLVREAAAPLLPKIIEAESRFEVLNPQFADAPPKGDDA